MSKTLNKVAIGLPIVALLNFLGCASAPKSGTSYDKAIRSSFQATLPQLQGCYEETLKETPNVGGVWTLNWSIVANGKVTAAKVAKRDFDSPKLEKCVLEKVQATKFPSAPAGKVMDVSYPVHFEVGKN